MFFHKHTFLESTKDPEILYCMCGKTKDLHRHIWKHYKEIYGDKTNNIFGEVLKCEVCGELKNHYL